MDWYSVARLWGNIKVGTFAECWEWQADKDDNGYGRISIDGKQLKTHRVAFMAAGCELPEGKLVLHKCDNRACCNPRHLYAGDYKDNYRDMVERGRTNFAHGEKHPKAKLTPDDVAAIRASAMKGVELARVYNVCPSTISMIRSYNKYK